MKTVDIRSMGTNLWVCSTTESSSGNAQNGRIDLGKFSLNIEEISIQRTEKRHLPVGQRFRRGRNDISPHQASAFPRQTPLQPEPDFPHRQLRPRQSFGKVRIQNLRPDKRVGKHGIHIRNRQIPLPIQKAFPRPHSGMGRPRHAKTATYTLSAQKREYTDESAEDAGTQNSTITTVKKGFPGR